MERSDKPAGFQQGRGSEAGLWGEGGGDGPAGTAPADRVADMASSRVPQQLFLQGVAAVYTFAFASLYTQIPGEGAESGTHSRGIIPSFTLSTIPRRRV